ncbi:MAG: SDR family oxidoreductase [Alphaproteobacteria bacterium]|nr:SDR family oxidoreductase [Alphaproteobacteria bacterium]
MRIEGKEIVVTGGTDGIGKVAAAELAKAGANVTIVGRDGAKGEAVVRELKALAGHDRIGFVKGDLSVRSGVHAAVGALTDRLAHIDVLLNNAGALFQRRELTQDGIERTFALNHLGYFLITSLLMERLKASPAARIVNVASGAHAGAKLDLDDLQNEKNYSGWRAYQQSKLANIYFTYELARRIEGTTVTANCLHPGFVATRFGDNNGGWLRTVFGVAKSLLAKTEADGAQTSIYLAGSPDVANVSGKYFDNCKAVRSSAVSYDEGIARSLWLASEQLTGQ